MLKINIGKQELEANNVVGIYGETGTGKSYLMAQIAYRMSMNDFCMSVLPLDYVMMQSITEEIKDKYTQAITSLADKYPVILLVDSMELLQDSDPQFYEILKIRVNAGKWNVIYTSQEKNKDLNFDNNVLIHTKKTGGIFQAEIKVPKRIETEKINVASF